MANLFNAATRAKLDFVLRLLQNDSPENPFMGETAAKYLVELANETTGLRSFRPDDFKDRPKSTILAWLKQIAAATCCDCNAVPNISTSAVGAGTAYNLTTGFSHVVFGTSNADINISTPGSYLCLIQTVIQGAVAGTGDAIQVEFFDPTVLGGMFGVMAGQNCQIASDTLTFNLATILAINEPRTLQIFARNATSARGTVIAAQTSLSAILLF